MRFSRGDLVIYLLGLVVNPKLRKPVLVLVDESGRRSDVRIHAPDRETEEYIGIPYEGEGQYEGGDSPPSEITGYPRVHTPSGVETKGAGYGTSLYTGLCLGARLDRDIGEDGWLRIGSKYSGTGICSSPDDRSSAADKWWESAKQRGLASDASGPVTEEGVYLSLDASDLSACGIEEDGKRIVHVSEAIGDTEADVAADVYVYQDAIDNDLVVAAFAENKFDVSEFDPDIVTEFWRGIRDGTAPKPLEIHDDALVALDLRDVDERLVSLILTCGVAAGLSDELLEGMRLRAELGLDPDTKLQQQHLPFSPNSAEGRLVRDSLDYAKYVRDKLAWRKLASLP